MKILISLLVVVIYMMTSTALQGQNKDPVKNWQALGENDSLVVESLSINSVKDDYAPIFMNGTLYFSSNRKDRHTDEAELQYNESIYASRFQDSTWSKPKKYYFFNSDDYTALAGFSADRSKLFTYKTFGGGDVYCSLQNEKGKWFRPKRMKYVNSSYHEQSLAEANGIMVVSSERPGGLGKHDLYWAIADDDGQYRNFVPLLIANTNGDEVDVSFNADGNILYFSSDVGGTSGGYDFFAIEVDSIRQWSKPNELSINTPDDDRWFMNCDSMFFCTRSGKTGGDDLYWGHIVPKHLQKDTCILVEVDTLEVEIDTNVFVENIINLNERPTEQVFFTPDGSPDTLKQEKLLKIYDVLDSLEFEVYIAQVQVGAYYYVRSVDEFKNNYQSFDTTNIVIEKVETKRGTLFKYMINKKYKTLKESAVRQQEALRQQTADINKSYYPKGRPYDAFIVVYNQDRERIIIYFNVETGACEILVGDKKIYF